MTEACSRCGALVIGPFHECSGRPDWFAIARRIAKRVPASPSQPSERGPYTEEDMAHDLRRWVGP